MPAIDADLNNLAGLALDNAGNYYVAGYAMNRVYRVDATGFLTAVAGTAGYSGDGVPGGAASAMVNWPQSVAVDSSGNVYISDSFNCVVRKVDATNTITTIAGQVGSCAYNGSGGPGTSEYLTSPAGLALDNAGNLYIADTYCSRVRKLVLSTGYLYDFATFNAPVGVAADGQGNVYVLDFVTYQIYEVNASTGSVSVIAGNGNEGYSGDGGPATQAEIGRAYQLAVDSAGTTITLADATNDVIRQFAIGGNITTIAGTSNRTSCGPNGGPAVNVCFNYPMGVAVASSGTIYVADNDDGYIRTFAVGGNINIVGGDGQGMSIPTNGIAPTGTEVDRPLGVMEDSSGNVYFSEGQGARVRELTASSGLVDFFAGTGESTYGGDGGPAVNAQLAEPVGLAMDNAGNVYIADEAVCVVRMVNPEGIISTFAGNSFKCSYGGDGGSPAKANLNGPTSVFIDSHDNIYIADTYNHAIRKIAAGIITTVAGTGEAGFSGDGGPATGAMLDRPAAVTEDGAGNVYIADSYNCRIREIPAGTGIIHTVAGNGSCGFSGDGIATQNSLYYPQDVKADVNGNLFIADTNNNLVRWVAPSGVLTTFAGNGTYGFSGDGGPAKSAEFAEPSAILEDAGGNFLVADEYTDRIRAITAFAGLGVSTLDMTFPTTVLNGASTPETLTLSGVGPLTIGSIAVNGPFTQSNTCGSSLPNGQTCTVSVSYKPTGTGLQTGSVQIQTNGYFVSLETVTLQGTGTTIAVSGSPVSFGKQLTGTTSAARKVTITNRGKAGINMGVITLTETTDFAIASNTCPASGGVLAAHANCAVGLTFTPQSTGAKQGVLEIADSDAAAPQTVDLSGTGTSGMALSPGSLTFAVQPIGTKSKSSRVTLTNNTGAAVTLADPAVTVTGPFAIASNTTCANNLSIAPKAACIIEIKFAPVAAGAAADTLTVTDSDHSSRKPWLSRAQAQPLNSHRRL